MNLCPAELELGGDEGWIEKCDLPEGHKGNHYGSNWLEYLNDGGKWEHQNFNIIWGKPMPGKRDR